MPLVFSMTSGRRFSDGFVWLQGVDASAPLSVRLVLAFTSFLSLSSVGRGSASSEQRYMSYWVSQLHDSLPPGDVEHHLQCKILTVHVCCPAA